MKNESYCGLGILETNWDKMAPFLNNYNIIPNKRGSRPVPGAVMERCRPTLGPVIINNVCFFGVRNKGAIEGTAGWTRRDLRSDGRFTFCRFPRVCMSYTRDFR